MARVFQRSLIAHGLRGMSISLPRVWLEYYGLKPGDRVQVIDNGDLIVRPLSK